MTTIVPGCNVQIERSAAQTTVAFRGPKTVWDEETSAAVARHLAELAAGVRDGTLALDFGRVAYFTSTMLGKLVGLHKSLGAVGGKLVLVNLEPAVYDIFQRTRLDSFLEIRPGQTLAHAG